ncbi:MAG: hypothetical protein ACREVL_14985, partial [Solimonas sp.]
MSTRLLARLAVAGLALAAGAAHAQGSDAEKRLRDLLRQTALELRDQQGQNAELRSQLAELQARLAARQPEKPAAAPPSDGAA